MASISGKTASLYATAARIGGLVAGFDDSLTDALTEYGEAYGNVFQIVDDLLDITSTDDQLGKPAGHDMVEGVYTLPVLRTLQAGGVPAMELLALLGKPLDAAEREKALGDRALQRRHRLGVLDSRAVGPACRGRLRRAATLGGHRRSACRALCSCRLGHPSHLTIVSLRPGLPFVLHKPLLRGVTRWGRA